MEQRIDRKAAVAGQFYPKDSSQLSVMMDSFFNQLENPKVYHNVLAIIAPHAGYVYSGLVAASAYNQIDPSREIKNIFILAPSHHASFDGASIFEYR